MAEMYVYADIEILDFDEYKRKMGGECYIENEEMDDFTYVHNYHVFIRLQNGLGGTLTIDLIPDKKEPNRWFSGVKEGLLINYPFQLWISVYSNPDAIREPYLILRDKTKDSYNIYQGPPHDKFVSGIVWNFGRFQSVLIDIETHVPLCKKIMNNKLM